MSYFDGIIPEVCLNCFYWSGQRWVHIKPGHCGSCEHMPAMFPLIDKDKQQYLLNMDEPSWHLRPLWNQ